jgi:hypothetical protein
MCCRPFVCSNLWWRPDWLKRGAASAKVSVTTAEPTSVLSAAYSNAQRKLQLQKLQAEQLTANELRVVLATMIHQRTLHEGGKWEVGNYSSSPGKRQQWQQHICFEGPFQRVRTLLYMLRHDVAPFNLCNVHISFMEKFAAVCSALPWLFKSRSHLLAWELKHMPELQALGQLKQLQLLDAASYDGASVWEVATCQSVHAARLLMFSDAVRYTLAQSHFCRNPRCRRGCGGLPDVCQTNGLHVRPAANSLTASSGQPLVNRQLQHTAGQPDPDRKDLQGDSAHEAHYQAQLQQYTKSPYPDIQQLLHDAITAGRLNDSKYKTWLMGISLPTTDGLAGGAACTRGMHNASLPSPAMSPGNQSPGTTSASRDQPLHLDESRSAPIIALCHSPNRRVPVKIINTAATHGGQLLC